jgi:hypothetical protein
VAKQKGERILRSITGSLSTAALDGNALALALETLGGNQTLDLGSLGVLLLALLDDGTADDELADVVLLVETEEATDLGGTLGAETLGDNGVGETGELTLTLLDDAQGKDGKVQTGDGTANGLALALTSAAGAVAAVAVGEEQTGTGGEENCSKKFDEYSGRFVVVVSPGEIGGFFFPVIPQVVVRLCTYHPASWGNL